jgi:hypothetical protein
MFLGLLFILKMSVIEEFDYVGDVNMSDVESVMDIDPSFFGGISKEDADQEPEAEVNLVKYSS